MRATWPDISERQTCRVLRVVRSALHRTTATTVPTPKLAAGLVTKLHRLLQQYPTDGYRRLWALLRYREGLVVNRKAVDRALRLKGWMVHQRTRTPRPRAQ